MNILFLTNNQQPKDGWSVVGYNIVKNSTSMDCCFEVFSHEEKSYLGLGYRKLKSSLYQRYKFLAIIYDLINILISSKQRPDFIHCNVEHYAPVAMILSKLYKVPYTLTAHGTYSVRLPKKHKIYKRAFENSYKVIAVSHFTKSRMVAEGINANYEVIFLGVDKHVFKPNHSVKKEEIITFVGNLKLRKGLKFLLESMVEVSKQKSYIKVLIIGRIDFSCQAYLDVKNFISSHKLDIKFIGQVSEEELVRYYQKSKLNILPSQSQPFYFEGFGLVHTEANACGTLTIGTYNSGNEDAISNGNGYLVEYGNIQALSEKILEVFSDENYPLIELNKVNSWEVVANKYFDVWKSLQFDK